MNRRICSLKMFRRQAILLLAGLIGLPALAQADSEGWLMRGGDTRRTGRAHVVGPQVGVVAWTYLASNALSINMEPTVTNDHVFFGTWGVIRKHGEPKEQWDRFDGTVHGLGTGDGTPAWRPPVLNVTPYAYRYAERPTTEQDRGAGKGLHLNFYSGTVEGTAAVDPKDGSLYFGRGDGRLYAVDPQSGKVDWTFQTLDPQRPGDPETGGQIVGGPLVTPGGDIVFATFGAPASPDPHPHTLVRSQTNAVYAVGRDGSLRWRYPETGSLENPFSAPVALSRSGHRVYAITQRVNSAKSARLVALNTKTGKLIWEMNFRKRGGEDLAVGIDGVLYVAGISLDNYGRVPTAFAIRDRRDHGEVLWTAPFRDQVTAAHWAAGIALFEKDGVVQHVYVSTTNARENAGRGGKLHRLDPATGSINATFDPNKAEPRGSGGLTDITLGNDGVVYVGARGYEGGLIVRGVPARMYALLSREDGFAVLWSVPITGGLDKASPAIGPEGGLYFGSTARLSKLDPLEPQPPGAPVKNAGPVFYSVMDPR